MLFSSTRQALLVMVSSELVVLLIVCVGINTGSAQQGELATNTHLKSTILMFQCTLDLLTVCYHCTLFTDICQDETDRWCTFNSEFDPGFDCVSTTLNCVNSKCTAVIHAVPRGCQFTKAEAPQPIHCCLCYPSTPGPPLWNCIATTPSLSLLPSGEYSIALSTYNNYS